MRRNCSIAQVNLKEDARMKTYHPFRKIFGVLVLVILLIAGCGGGGGGSSSGGGGTPAGTLDSSFGNGGIVVHGNAAGGNGNDLGNSITTDSQGRILVAGVSRNTADNFDMAIWRYNSDGTLDTAFNSNSTTPGIVVHGDAAGGNSHDYGNSITTDSQERILVTGYSYNSSNNSDMVIWRYMPDGSLDSTFGNNGIVVHDNAAGGNKHDYGFSITIDSQGRILVTGSSFNGSDYDMVIWCYDSSGAPCSGFGAGGVVVDDSAAGGNGDDYSNSVIIDSQGRILVAGASFNGSDYDMVIWCYDSSGVPCSGFGAGGVVVDDSAAGGNDYDSGLSVTTDSQDRILVTGDSYNSSNNSDMVIWRYMPDGSLDSTFGNNGIVVHDNASGGNSDDEGSSITIDSQERILVTGYSYNSSNNSDMVIWRYMPDGSLDSTFGNNGIVVHDNAAGGNSDDEGRSITIDSEDRILVTGYSYNSSDNTEDMVIWRYVP